MNGSRLPKDLSEESVLAEVADDFLARVGRGERPEVEDYVRRHPELGDVLRQVLPALQVLVAPAGSAVPADRSATQRPSGSGGLGERPSRPRPPWTEGAWRWCRGNKVAAGLAALLGMAALGGLAVTTWKWQEERQARAAADRRAEEIHADLEKLRTAQALWSSANHHLDQQRWAAAESNFTLLTELLPDHAGAWEQRGNLYARLRLWELAEADFERFLDLARPPSTQALWRSAVLSLYRGDDQGYGRACIRLAESLGETSDAKSGSLTAGTCVLGPKSVMDPAEAVRLAKKSLRHQASPGRQHFVLGLAYDRAGQLEPAIRALRESLALETTLPFRALNHPVLAMAHHQRGQAHEARQALAEAVRTLDGWKRPFAQEDQDARATASWLVYLELQILCREAQTMIEGFPPPDDPRLRIARGRALATLRRDEPAAAEFTKALELAKLDAQAWLESLLARARWSAEVGRWEQSAADYALASERLPDDPDLGFERRAMLLLVGNLGDYLHLRSRLFDRAGKQAPPRTAYLAARAGALMSAAAVASLRPSAGGSETQIIDTTLPVQLARRAVAAEPKLGWHLHTLGLAYFRAGHLDLAVRRFRDATTQDPDWPGQGVNETALALAFHGLGRAEEARQALDRAAQWHDKAVAGPRSTGKASSVQLHDRLAYELLRREAEALVGGSPPAK